MLFGLSLLSPTYCTNVHCSGFGSGMMDLCLGWLGAIFYGGVYIAWYANLFIIIALILKKHAPIISLLLTLAAIIIGLTFLNGGEVLLNEAGHTGYITKIQFGYWLWMSGMFIQLIYLTLKISKSK